MRSGPGGWGRKRRSRQALGDLIADVAGLDLREDEGVGVASHLGAGELLLAHHGGDAASNCISPSMASSGAAALAFSQAFLTLSTASPLPEPLVE